MWIFFNKYTGKNVQELQQFDKTEETHSLEIQKKIKKKVCHECIKYM